MLKEKGIAIREAWLINKNKREISEDGRERRNKFSELQMESPYLRK